MRGTHITLFIALVLVAFISVRSAKETGGAYPETADTVFSVKRAFGDVLRIARAPHSMGTAGHDSVFGYIYAECNRIGLLTEAQTATSTRTIGDYVLSGRVSNIIARLKGTANGPSVLVMAHYDSQPNALGAGDDGAAVAAMLETARILKRRPPLRNDIIFLFTDGEEEGLLGARAFIRKSRLMKEVGLVINFDARGNRGPSVMFESNIGNGWMIGRYAKFAPHPFGSSLNYEIYKRLPNETDFSLFKAQGVAGLNSAFADGFAYYHSTMDSPGNLSMESLQCEGDNMLELTKCFGEADLRNIKAPDRTYFNLLGPMMITYPGAWNLFFLIFTDALFLFFILQAIGKRQVRPGAVVAGAGLFLGVLAILYFSAFGLISLINRWYPLNYRFYSNNAYNSHWYFLSISALSLAIFAGSFGIARRRMSLISLSAGVLLVELLLLHVLYIAMPTAVYILLFPVLFQLALWCFKVWRGADRGSSGWWNTSIEFFAALPALLLLTPVAYSLFLAFGLSSLTPAAAVIVGLMLGALLPAIDGNGKGLRLTIFVPACVCFLVFMIGGHSQSGFNSSHPLRTTLWYTINSDENKAYWSSDNREKDYWNKGFLSRQATLVPLPSPTAVLLRDTSDGNKRRVVVHFGTRHDAVSLSILADDSSTARLIKVDDTDVDGNDPKYPGVAFSRVEYYGIPAQGFDMTFELNRGSPLKFSLLDRSIGLPHVDNFTQYPADIIPGPGNYNNTIRIMKSISL